MPGGRPSPWLRGPAWDLGLISGPGLAASAVALALPPSAALSPALWLALVLGVDVAHVWTTLWRADPAAALARPGRWIGVPLACLGALLGLSWAAPGWFWTVLAYLAIFHFIRQQGGIAAVYRRAEGLPGRGAAARLERGAHAALALLPVLWWHAHLPRQIAWFTADDLLPGLPPALLPPAFAAGGLVVAAHLGQRLRERRWSPGRDLWLLTTAAVWWTGIVFTDHDLAFTLTNVVAHGVPYAALVWHTGNREWSRTGQGPHRPALFSAVALPVFIGLPLLLAFTEEALWDRLVWLERPAIFGSWEPLDALLDGDAPPDALRRALIALLAWPQVSHYVLDGLIWRGGPANPGLAEALGPAPR
jgi:hypothetical protein